MVLENCDEKFVSLEKFVIKNVCTMYEYMKRGEHCDVDIILDKKSYPVHKIVMLASSAYFRSKTWTKLNNSENQTITLYNVSFESLEWVIHFCYTGSIELKISNIKDIMNIASYLGVDELMDIGLNYWLNHITVKNCICITTLAHLYDKIDIWKVAFDFCCKHFMEIVKADEFLSSDYEFVLKLLKSDEIGVNSEEDVYQSLKRWVESDVNNRCQYISSLLECIKLNLLNLQFLSTEVVGFSISLPTICKNSMIDAITWRSSSEKNIEKSKPRPSTYKVLSVGGRNTAQASIIEIYNPLNNSWRTLFEFKNGKQLSEFDTVVIEDELFIIGGYSQLDSGFSNMMFSVNLKDNTVKTIPPFSIKRSELRSVELNGDIYVIGGYNGDKVNNVEKYNLKTQTWSNCSPMNITRAGFGLAVLDNKLYAAGGHNSQRRENSMEAFSPNTNKWIECKPMIKTRNYVELVAFERNLYAFGGSTGHLSAPVLIHDDFEMYDPSSNTWTLISNIPSPRICIGATTVNDEIILIGGFDGKSVMGDVDHYNPKTNTWRKGTISDKTKRQNARILTVANHCIIY